MINEAVPRRTILGAGLSAPLVVATSGWVQATPEQTWVDMEALLIAAQWDPVRTDSNITPGAGGSVRAVEEALAARGLLQSSYVDGHFGTVTVAGYLRWQRSLALSGVDVNGLPGPGSLRRLGAGRFRVTRTVDIGRRRTWRGRPLNDRTRRMLLAAEHRGRLRFDLTQGSYSPGEDPTSKGTHDGGGVVDIDAEKMSARQRRAAARALREVGFAAWVRSPDQDDWPWHLHAVAISDTDLHPTAQRQVGAYFEGRNGLAGNGPDDGPHVPRRTFEQFLRGEAS